MSTTSVMGGVVRRREDPALIRGTGTYTDDIKRAGMLHVAFVRSPFAHARINSIDTTAAKNAEGVHAVYTIDDVRHLGPLLAQAPVGKLRPLLAEGVVNHAGEAVAMVVAENRYLAQDAADLVDVDYDVLPAVIDLEEAVSDAVKVHDDLDSNVIMTWAGGPWGDEDATAETKKKIEEAKARDDAVVVSLKMNNQRLIPVAIEPRSVIADWNAGYSRFDVWSSSQIPHALSGAIAKTFGLASNSVRVVAPEVGGGFGCKLNVYNDEMLVCFASQKLGRPVKFTETRRESANSTIQGRGWIGTATLVGTADGEILGYELDAIADMGAYSQDFTAAIPFLGVFVLSGQYGMPTAFSIRCVHTNTMTTDAYRGAGRPETIYYLERIVDAFARKIGMDPVEVRKKNFIPATEFPGAVSPIGFAFDTGDYAKNLDALASAVGYPELRAERDRLRSEGRHVGIGLSTYVEACGFGPAALAELGFSWASYGMPQSFNGTALVRVNPDASVSVLTGTGPSGQGHQTTWAQIVGDRLGIDVERITVRHGDTADLPMGVGTFGSRSTAVDGAATYEAAMAVRTKAAKIAAHMLEAAEEDIRFDDGKAYVAGSPDQSIDWSEIAAVAYRPDKVPEGLDPGLEVHTVWSPGNATWPFGAHLAMVEVDPDTGDVKLLRYVAVDDCGKVINPMIVDGQLHGGIAQGIGQALYEEAVYDSDGNLLTGSLMNYSVPGAVDFPRFELFRTETPTDVNPLGAKGIGEAGTIGAAQTIVHAVLDALSEFGVDNIDMPMKPRRVWQAIQDAKGGN